MFKNFGATAQKFTFQIDVQKVILPDMLEHFEGTEQLAVGFERKNYPPIFTKDSSITLNDQDEIVAEWHEPLITHATMFKDSKTGLYKEKMGKLNLLQRRPGFMGVAPALDAFKSLGMATVPLHVYANPNKTVTNIKLHLSWCASEHAYLIVDISATLGDNSMPIDLKSETGSVDDTRSVESGAGSSSATKPALSSLALTSSSSRPSGSSILGAGPNKGVTTIKEEDNEDEEDDPFSRHVHSGKKPPLGKPSSGSTSNRPLSVGSSSTALTQIGSATSPVAFVADTPDEKRFQATLLYQKMKQRIDDLEVALLNSDEVVAFEKKRAREALEIASKFEDELSSTANNNQLLSKLQSDYEALKEENKLLKETNANVSSALAKYTGEGSKMQSMITRNSDEITYLRDEKMKLEKLLRDKNDECENLLSELIKTKVSVGEMAEEFEETKKELRTMKAAKEKAMEARRAREAAAAAANGGVVPPRPAPSAAPAAAKRPAGTAAAATGSTPSTANRERPQTQQGQGQQGQGQQGRGNNSGNNNSNNNGGYSNYNNPMNNGNVSGNSGGGNNGYNNSNYGNNGGYGNNNNNNNGGGYNDNDNMSVSSGGGYSNYHQNNGQFSGNNNMNGNFNSNFSSHSNNSGGGGGGGYGNTNNNNNTMGGNNNNNGMGYNNNNNGGYGGFNGNMQTPMNNGNNYSNNGSNFFTPNSTPGRANPFASVGQQMGQMGNNVGSTLLRGFNTVSNVFNEGNNGNNGPSSSQRRNPPPRPSFN